MTVGMAKDRMFGMVMQKKDAKSKWETTNYKADSCADFSMNRFEMASVYAMWNSTAQWNEAQPTKCGLSQRQSVLVNIPCKFDVTSPAPLEFASLRGMAILILWFTQVYLIPCSEMD